MLRGGDHPRGSGLGRLSGITIVTGASVSEGSELRGFSDRRRCIRAGTALGDAAGHCELTAGSWTDTHGALCDGMSGMRGDARVVLAFRVGIRPKPGRPELVGREYSWVGKGIMFASRGGSGADHMT